MSRLKEKIEQLSKGVFTYQVPDIILSEEKIEMTVESGKTFQGSFSIKNSDNSSMKGILYSNNKRFQLLEENFIGEENLIYYEINMEHLNSGEVIKGEVSIICSDGETSLPFIVTVETPYSMTSLGKIKDMFHFTNLAKEDWAEAVKLFKSADFEKIFLQYDKKSRTQYRYLMRSISSSQAMEEFLITMRKKLPINLKIDKSSLSFTVTQGKYMDKIVLTKDSWGYLEIKVSADEPFIIPDHKIVWADNFIGSTYNLEFMINSEFLRAGMNYGRLYLKTVHQELIVDITCEYIVEGKERDLSVRKKKSFEMKLLQNYISFRTRKMSVEQYVSESKILIQYLGTEIDDVFYDLIRIHLNIISGDTGLAVEQLQSFKDREETIKDNSILCYCGYLYLNALLKKDDETIRSTVDEITRYYTNSHFDWKILWLLLYLDTKYDHNRSLKLSDMKRQFDLGCHSPVLYYEVIAVFNEEPVLLKELSSFWLQAVYFGIKNDILSKDAAAQFTYLAQHQKSFNKLIYQGLVLLYKKYQSKDILTAICSILIRGQKVDNKYFPWYCLGVDSQLRITQLHEYYMYALAEEDHVTLPQSILLYFMYNTTLTEQKKAYLYADIIKNKETNPAMYQSYYKKIESYCLKQLGNNMINESLSIIYEEILTEDTLTKDMAANLTNILFRHQLYCANPNIKGICVIHKEIDEEIIIPLKDGSAQINIFTNDAEVFLIDNNDNRYIKTIDYTLNPLIQSWKYLDKCFELCPSNKMLLLCLYEKAESYHKFDRNSMEIRKRILELENIRVKYKETILSILIQYYYDNFEGELLDSYLLQVDVKYLSKNERGKVIEYMIIRKFTDYAKNLLMQYGYEGISVKRIMKLVSSLIMSGNQEEKQDFLLELSHYILKEGKYNDIILKYLVKYYNGTTKEMLNIWKAAKGFDIPTVELEERLLGQVLFTETYMAEGGKVFINYYKEGSNKKLIRAFLSYYAYKYLVNDRVVQTEIFDIIKRESFYEENEVCMIALLKYFSFKENLTEDEIKLIDFNLHKLMENGIILPFYQLFNNRMSIPESIRNKYYIEYKANPKKKVSIYYRFHEQCGSEDTSEIKEEDFIKETMKNVYEGIFVKDILLFYHEGFDYYIVEEDSETEIKSELISIKMDYLPEIADRSRYQQINRMMQLMEEKETDLLKETMEQYICVEYIANEIFKPL